MVQHPLEDGLTVALTEILFDTDYRLRRRPRPRGTLSAMRTSLVLYPGTYCRLNSPGGPGACVSLVGTPWERGRLARRRFHARPVHVKLPTKLTQSLNTPILLWRNYSCDSIPDNVWHYSRENSRFSVSIEGGKEQDSLEGDEQCSNADLLSGPL